MSSNLNSNFVTSLSLSFLMVYVLVSVFFGKYKAFVVAWTSSTVFFAKGLRAISRLDVRCPWPTLLIASLIASSSCWQSKITCRYQRREDSEMLSPMLCRGYVVKHFYRFVSYRIDFWDSQPVWLAVSWSVFSLISCLIWVWYVEICTVCFVKTENICCWSPHFVDRDWLFSFCCWLLGWQPVVYLVLRINCYKDVLW